MNVRRRRGFTLVELLVVISIIGMLAALVMPAVQAAREAARRVTCINNQRQLSLAAINYESSRRAFPGYLNEIGAYSDGTPICASWVVSLFPYIERSDLWELWTKDWVDEDGDGVFDGVVYVEVLVCPSDASIQQSPGSTPCSYRVNCGRQGNVAGGVVDDISAGVCDVVMPAFRNFGLPPSPVSIDYIGQHDGTSNTLFLSENVRSGNWTDGSAFSTRGVIPDTSSVANFVGGLNAAEAALGFRIPQAIDMATYPRYGMEYINENLLDSNRTAIPACYHTGGIVVAFCDNQARFLSESIDKRTFLHLMTPYGKKAKQKAVDNSWSHYDVMTGVLDKGTIY